MSGPETITLGCRLNFAESEAMRAMAAGRDDLVIVNSCAVTAEAVRKTRQQIRKARKARPDAEIIVTGCAAQIETTSFAGMPEVDRVLGNREKMEATSFAAPQPVCPELVEGRGNNTQTVADVRPSTGSGRTGGGFAIPGEAKIRVSDIMAVRKTAPHLVTGFAERARAFVEVQNGCDHRCTFCIIPHGRGNSRSVPAGLVVERIKALVDEGFQEVVLTGVDVTSYGPDLPGQPNLGLLVERILKGVPDLPRLRLSSIDSVEIDERLFEIITGDPRMMPHLHLSLQAGDDMILKRMKRRHSRAQAVEIVERLKSARPEIAIGADIIAGFPTESDEMAANTLRLVKDCDIVYGHIFPYSTRKGTPAARMPQLSVAIRKQRAARLREACARQKIEWLESLVGTRQKVLMESSAGGHTESFAKFTLRHSRESGNPAASSPAETQQGREEWKKRDSRFRGNDGIGDIVRVRVTGRDGAALVGEPV